MKYVDGVRIPLSPEDEAQRAIDDANPPPAEATRIEWGTLIRSLTTEEAAAFDAAVQAAEPRFRWLIQKTAYISTDDPDYPTLTGAFDNAYGQARSDELLPPTV